jgi:hypothetical protein
MVGRANPTFDRPIPYGFEIVYIAIQNTLLCYRYRCMHAGLLRGGSRIICES